MKIYYVLNPSSSSSSSSSLKFDFASYYYCSLLCSPGYMRETQMLGSNVICADVVHTCHKTVR